MDAWEIWWENLGWRFVFLFYMPAGGAFYGILYLNRTWLALIFAMIFLSVSAFAAYKLEEANERSY